jgi:hypothetical protein
MTIYKNISKCVEYVFKEIKSILTVTNSNVKMA